MTRCFGLLSLLGCLVACPADDAEEMTTSDPTSETNVDSSSDEGGGCLASTPNNTSDGSSDDLQQTWGSACTMDAECVTLLGAGAICAFDAVIYELPGGYCTKECDLEPGVTVNVDDPNCDPAGGVNCIGADGVFERCSPPCTDDMQCPRDGYYCRQMPMISQMDDPTFCLMPDCCLLGMCD